MKRALRLVPRGSEDLLAVTWDDETGAIDGDGAAEVDAWIDRYKPGTAIPCMPECSGYTLSAEPRKSMADMAAMLHNGFRIPEWLMAHYPEPDEDADEADFEDGDGLPIIPVAH